MLEDLLGSSAYGIFLDYLRSPTTHLAVIIPGVLSLAILGFYSRLGRISERLQLLWMLALSIAFYSASWDVSGDMQRLYVYSAFSVTCAMLLFNRMYISPALAYALTFLSLWWVDVTRAFCYALECGKPLEEFYVGVGGAGLLDALFIVPLLTAGVVGYASARLKRQHAPLLAI
jgi:hypothetical protein